MKKILVVFMILAVAGGVFAQEGTWSLSSAGGLGAHINFDPDPEVDGDVPLIRGVNYQRTYRQYTQIWGELGIGYTRGILATRLLFSTEGQIQGRAVMNGDNYYFYVESNMNEWLQLPMGAGMLNGGGEGQPTGKFVNRLWGSYTMLDGIAFLQVAYRGPDTEPWVSDKTAAIDGDNFQIPYRYTQTRDANGNFVIKKTPADRRYRVLGSDNNIHNYTAANPSQIVFEDGHTFTKVDRAQFLLGQISVGGLQAGLMIPNFFPTTYTSGTNSANNNQAWVNSWEGPTPEFTDFGVGKWGQGVKFIDETLAQTIFGAKFNVHPVEVAAQLKFADYGVYFGAKFFAGPVTAGLSFMGTMGKVQLGTVAGDKDGNMYAPQLGRTDSRVTGTTTTGKDFADNGWVVGAFGHVYDASVTKIGGRVDYNGGSFGAALKGFYGVQAGKLGSKDADGNTNGSGLLSSYSVIGIEPAFFINAIPSHLNFRLDAGFYFETYTAPDATTLASADVKATYWALQPAISWNFKGTGAVGATNYHGMNTGMFFRYRIVSNAVNALDIAFLFGL